MRKPAPEPFPTPVFTHQDVRYAVDEATYARATGLVRSNKVQNLRAVPRGYAALVDGTKTYHVNVHKKNVDYGGCTCPMGDRDCLCKHMIAVALATLDQAGVSETAATPPDFAAAKKQIQSGVRKFVPYGVPSSQYFAYQRKLSTGRGLIEDALPAVSPGKTEATYLWKTVLRICNKLATTGIDDSEGEVGGAVTAIVSVLGTWAKEHPDLQTTISGFCNDDTHFGFEDELKQLLI